MVASDEHDPVTGIRLIQGAVDYSDGAEDAVFRTLSEAHDRSVGSDELASAIVDWPTRYHFSRLRANLLRPLALRPGLRALDVGAGSGALARFLGEAGLEVVALEGTLARARSAALRCESLTNVEVVCGDLEAFEDPSGFDIVTCVGVLEYVPAPRRTSFLKRLRALTRPTGVLVLAIENQLGLKYLLGYGEDHSGEPWLGVEGYPGQTPARTFSRACLTQMLSQADFGAQRWLFPFPDYKLPMVVLDESAYALEDASVLVDQFVGWPCSSDASAPLRLCDDRRAHRVFLEAGLGPHVANSFLVLAGGNQEAVRAACDPDVIAWRWGNDRLRAWSTGRTLHRTPNGLTLTFSRLAPLRLPERAWLSQSRPAEEPFVAGPTVERLALDACASGGAGLGAVLTTWRRHLLGLCEREAAFPSVEHPFASERTRHWLPADHLDVSLSNFVAGPDGSLTNVDREWAAAGPVDADLVCARALWYFAKDLVLRGTGHPWPSESTIDEVACRLGVLCDVAVSPATLSRLSEAEGDLQALVLGSSAEAVRKQVGAVGRCSLRTQEMSRHLPFRKLRSESADLQGRLAASERERLELSEEVARLRQSAEEVARLRQSAEDVARLRQSTSWRVTAPLRFVRRLLIRLTQGAGDSGPGGTG